MRTETGTAVRLQDYTPTPYAAPTVELVFDLDGKATRVRCDTAYVPRPGREGEPLVLAGDGLTLTAVALDGEALPEDAYEATADAFTLRAPPRRPFVLSITTTIAPDDNFALMGLYRSNGIYCTQCEAEGFRRITYAYDRPDVLSTYIVTLRWRDTEPDAADEEEGRIVLLSNGNLARLASEPGVLSATWEDPFPKPTYLFALVAGRLSTLTDHFTTQSGRAVELAIHVEPGKQHRARYAMDALKLSMRWDEKVFGREYDLDVFNIVAVSDFNMGAMENKGLNIFNDRYVLAEPGAATDADYAGIETVIAHEYFHNWTGNRITCRDWFQLCLKEGLTVYRDQEFTAAVRSPGMKRLEDVRRLRMTQFREDASPLRHPVRPDQYAEISNLYTPTVYEKGAEIIRMLRQFVGDEAFFEGMTRFFEVHDGAAVTVEDFLECFEGAPFDALMAWYEEAGTPTVRITESFADGTYEATFRQVPAKDAGKKAIPIRMTFFDTSREIPLSEATVDGERIRDFVVLKDEPLTVSLHDQAEKPTASFLRGLSAPVRIDLEEDLDRDLDIMRRDDDPVCVWNATQRVLIAWILGVYRGDAPDLSEIAEALATVSRSQVYDPAFRAALLQVPSRIAIYEALSQDIDTDEVEYAYRRLCHRLSELMEPTLDRLLALPRAAASDVSFVAAAQRALHNAALHLKTYGNNRTLAIEQAANSANLTDQLAALAALAAADAPETDATLAGFHDQVEADPLVLDKYFALQASRTDDLALARTQELMAHPRFSMANPNRVRAVIGAFTQNGAAFHRADGSGYRMVGEAIANLDERNPQLAARLMGAFADHARMNEIRRLAARDVLRTISAGAKSSDVRDMIQRLTAE